MFLHFIYIRNDEQVLKRLCSLQIWSFTCRALIMAASWQMRHPPSPCPSSTTSWRKRWWLSSATWGISPMSRWPASWTSLRKQIVAMLTVGKSGLCERCVLKWKQKWRDVWETFTRLNRLLCIEEKQRLTLWLQVQLYDWQCHPADHGHPTPAGHLRAGAQVSPAGQLRADGGGQHRTDSRRALQRHPGGHAAGSVAPHRLRLILKRLFRSPVCLTWNLVSGFQLHFSRTVYLNKTWMRWTLRSFETRYTR